MDCNKDEAIKCKGIAEKKLEEEDMAGAKRFALKAQSLFPKLDGLSDFLEVINIYIASQKKINGESDLYGIFGLDPSVDDATLRKKYRNMALALHPDKNKAVGTNGAFNILSEAWSILSNKDTRSAYNLRLNLKSPHLPIPTDKNGFNFASSSTSQYHPMNMATAAKPQQVPTQSRTSATATNSYCDLPQWPKNTRAASVGQRGHKKTKKSAANSGQAANPLQPRKPKTTPKAQHIPSKRKTAKTASNSTFVHTPSQARSHTTAMHTSASCLQPFPCPSLGAETFWTSCHNCKMQFEYLKIYLNQNLLCFNPHCRRPFLATEKPPPAPGSVYSSPGCCAAHQWEPGWSGASECSGCASSGSRASRTEKVQSVVDNLKRGHEEAVSASESKVPIEKWNVGEQEWKNAQKGSCA